jgi:hypothetical protein
MHALLVSSEPPTRVCCPFMPLSADSSMIPDCIVAFALRYSVPRAITAAIVSASMGVLALDGMFSRILMYNLGLE